MRGILGQVHRARSDRGGEDTKVVLEGRFRGGGPEEPRQGPELVLGVGLGIVEPGSERPAVEPEAGLGAVERGTVEPGAELGTVEPEAELGVVGRGIVEIGIAAFEGTGSRSGGLHR